MTAAITRWRARSRWLALLLALVLSPACTVDRDVLVARPSITTCDAALAGSSGATCAFEGTCMQASPDDTACCTDVATCEANMLVVTQSCAPECKPCTSDPDCTYGAAICTATVCEACPSVSACAACPAGWTRLERNGCPTCDCAPPATCTAPTTNATCITGSTCYQGEDCTSGCAASDTSCCSNQCAAAGCTGPIPVGCLADCGSGTAAQGCTTCAATHCDCVSGEWSCTIGCVEGAHASCVAP